MSEKNQISFFAQHRRGSIVFFPLFSLAVSIGLLIALLITQNQFVVLWVLVLSFVVISIGLCVLLLLIFAHRLIITENEIILKGITGIIKQYKKADIERIVYRSSYMKSSVPYLIIEDRLSTNRRTDTITNKKDAFIKLDCNKERVDIIAKFWHGAIDGLPEKYKN